MHRLLFVLLNSVCVEEYGMRSIKLVCLHLDLQVAISKVPGCSGFLGRTENRR